MVAIKRGIKGICAVLLLAGMVTGCAVQPTELVEVESTMISHVGYNPASGELTVVFREAGDSYVYQNVPEDVYTGLVTAESPGRFFHANIREAYEFTRSE